MKKFNVTFEYSTTIVVEVEANSQEEAKQIARSEGIDFEQMIDNLVEKIATATEEVPDVYEMKCALEDDGWDWDTLDMMDDEEIEVNYRELSNQ